MKIQASFRQALAFAVGTALSVAGLSCNQGPVNYDKFEQRTLEANLAAIDSATSVYFTQLAAGDTSAAVQQARGVLLAQPGVEAVSVSPDSTIWAFFSSGLLAGTGVLRRALGAALEPAEPNSSVEASSGGEVGDFTHYVLPFDQELPCTRKAADAIKGIFKRHLGWDNDETFTGAQVDLGLVLGLIKPGNSVLFWSGHGTIAPESVGGYNVSSLILGKPYAQRQMAEATAKQYAGYLNPGPGQKAQVAIYEDSVHRFYHVVLPEFIRANGDFNGSESLPINQTRTIVYLSCCYSGCYGLALAFSDAGADVVYAYSDRVSDNWSCEKDTTVFKALSDTCLTQESDYAGPLSDPSTGARLMRFGDTLVTLRAICTVNRDGDTLRASLVQGMRDGSGSGINAILCPDGSDEVAANVMIGFPGDQPGLFNCTSDENATIYWTDAGTGYTYTVMKNYVGVNGTISVDRCRSDAITGHFHGKLGWWDFGKDPEKEPPTDTIALRDGVFKFTGKVGSGKLSPQRLAAGMPPTVR